MNTVLLACFGVLQAIFLVGAVVDTAARKAPWSEFILTAAFGAAMVGGIAWLANIAWHWLADGGWVWFFLLIIAVPVWFWLGCMALMAMLHIAERCGPHRD